MSLKQQGNELFRIGKYQQALRCYEEYIETDPNADKKAAHCNISCCYYRLGQWQESIDAADDAVCEDATYKKGYYRKMQGFKEIGGHEYEIFVNYMLLLRHGEDIGEKDRYDYQVEMKKTKEEWLKVTRRGEREIQGECCIFGQMEVEQELKSKSVEEWLSEWKKQGNWQESWYKIQQVAKQDINYALDVAFLFLNNQEQSFVYYQDLKSRIKKLQELVLIKRVDDGEQQQKSEELPFKKSKQSDSSEQNLFESSDNSGQGQKDGKSIGQKQKVDAKQVEKIEDKVEVNKEEVKHQGKNQQQKKNIEFQVNRLQKQYGQANGQNDVPPPARSEIDPEDVEALYKKYTSKLEQFSRDLIADILRLIEQILESSYSRGVKKQLLQMLKQNYAKNVLMMRKSFSKKQQQKVYSLLIKNELHQFLADFASKHTK